MKGCWCAEGTKHPHEWVTVKPGRKQMKMEKKKREPQDKG